MAQRVTDWTDAYRRVALEGLSLPFQWGEHDCVMFAAKVLDAVYDINLVSYIRANLGYANLSEAVALIEEHGSLEELVTEALGVEPIPPALLTHCDIAIYEYELPVDLGFTHALAVHDGHQLLAPAAHGLVQLPVGRAIKGWSLR